MSEGQPLPPVRAEGGEFTLAPKPEVSGQVCFPTKHQKMWSFVHVLKEVQDIFVTSLLLFFSFLVSPLFLSLSSSHCNLETENQGEKEGNLHILILEVGNPVVVLMSSDGGIG